MPDQETVIPFCTQIKQNPQFIEFPAVLIPRGHKVWLQRPFP